MNKADDQGKHGLHSFMNQEERRKPRVASDEQSRHSSMSRIKRNSGKPRSRNSSGPNERGNPSHSERTHRTTNSRTPKGTNRKTNSEEQLGDFLTTAENQSPKGRRGLDLKSVVVSPGKGGQQTYQVTGTKEEMIELLKALVEEDGEGEDTKTRSSNSQHNKGLGGFLKERKSKSRVQGEARSVMTSMLKTKPNEEEEQTATQEDTMSLLHNLAAVAPIRKKRGSHKGNETSPPVEPARQHRTQKTTVRAKHVSLTPKSSKGKVRISSGAMTSPDLKSPRSPGGSGHRRVRVPKSPRDSAGSGSSGSRKNRDSENYRSSRRHGSSSSSLDHSSSSLGRKGHSSSSSPSTPRKSRSRDHKSRNRSGDGDERKLRHSSGRSSSRSRKERRSSGRRTNRSKVPTIPEDDKLVDVEGTIANVSQVAQDDRRKVAKHLRRSSLSSASFQSNTNMDLPPPLLDDGAVKSPKSPSLRKKESSMTNELDVFSAYVWAAGKQNKETVHEERAKLRDSIRDSPLYKAFRRMELSVK